MKSILLYMGLIAGLICLNACDPKADLTTSAKMFGKADLRDMIDFSSANISIPITITVNISNVKGIAISSPTINLNVKVLDNYKQPIVGQLEVTVFRNQSKSSWLLWVLLALLLGTFAILIIHLRRIR